MEFLYGAEIIDNIRHTLRAVMGLYLAVIVSWLIGAFNPEFTDTALTVLIIFMFGFAGGRVLSWLTEGKVHPLLHIYLLLELLEGTIGLYLLMR